MRPEAELLLMDLDTHIRKALRVHPVGGESALIRAIADGVCNWINQRDGQITRRIAEGDELADWPSELLERASVLLAMAAIKAAKRENDK